MIINTLINWELKNQNKIKTIITLNFGPQHPAAHGVLRLILQLKNEYIKKIDIHIGLLHRGTEYLIQKRLYINNLGYFDRLDYVSMLSQEHAYCIGVENLVNQSYLNLWNNYIRVLFDELTRILNHLLALSCHALDIGSMSPLFWAFEERERIMEFYERISGARMHANYYKPFKLLNEINDYLLTDIIIFVKNCYKTISEISSSLTHNKIWKQRLVNIGIINIKDIEQFSITGVLARSVGIKKDVRLYQPYASYNNIVFNSFISFNGDCYDRFILRMSEMGESLFIITQCIKWLKNAKIFNLKNYKKNTMENIINEFKDWQIGEKFKNKKIQTSIETPKGEFGIFLISQNNTNKPIRCKIRSCSLHHLNSLSKMTLNTSLADLVALIGTIDIVFGEIDR